MPTDHSISLDQASTMTSSYRKGKDAILLSGYQGKNLLPICETFGRAAFDTLLGQTDCTSIRIYFGMDTDLKIHSIIVGVNSNNEDMIPSESNDLQIMEVGIRCPDDCPPKSDLNS